MAPKVCVNKLKKEMRAFLADPPPHVTAVHVNEKNMLGTHHELNSTCMNLVKSLHVYRPKAS